MDSYPSDMKQNVDLGFEKTETKKQSIGFVICENRETR
jgi:hypothetical protein